MNNYFKNLVSSEYDRDPGFIRLVRIVLTISTLAMAAITIVLVFTLNMTAISASIGILIVIVFLSALSLFLSYRNILWPGKILFPLSLLVAITFIAISSLGLHDSSVLGFTVVIIIASLITGQRAIPLATFFTLLGVGAVAYADMTGINKSLIAERTGWDDVTVISLIQIIAAASLNELMNRLNSALEASRSNEQILGQRVAERTKALETSAEISRRLASILDPRELASEVVEQVQKAYNYYYAQIYFFDTTGENLVLAAGTGEAGEAMLKRGHSLPKGRGLVGRAADTKASILVSDTSQDPNWLPNELLPNTKAEAVVPIIIGNKVLGVLDVQDDVTNDIFPEDITLLESLAGQVAISLQNAESYAKADAALQEAQSLVDNAPEAILIIDTETGLFSNPNENAVKLYGLSREELIKVGPAQMSPPNQPDGRDTTEKAMEKIGEAMQGGTPFFEWMHRNGEGNDFLCEIRLVRLPGAQPRVRASVTDISERKRTEDLTRRRAQQQESLNLITQKIQGATTIEAALQVTARELGHALGMKPTLVTLEPAVLTGESKVVVNEQP